MMAPGTSAMLRARRKDNNYKANRKLDRKSSRGMLYENEELRLRTININAEVERGQSDIKKLQRENQQLRREIWGLREEYDKLESIVRHQGSTDNEESVDDEDREYEEDEEEEEEDDDDNAQNQEKARAPPHKSAVGVQFDGLSIVDEETERDITPDSGANSLPLYVNLVPPQTQQPFFGKITLPSGKEGVFMSDSSAVPASKVRREGRVDAPLITIDGECGREDDEDGYFGIPGEGFRRGGPDLLLVPAPPRPKSPTPSMILEELIKFRSGRPEDTTHVVVTDYAAEGGALGVVTGDEHSSDVDREVAVEDGGHKSTVEDSNLELAPVENTMPGNSKTSISGEHSNRDGIGRYRSQLSVTLRQPGASSLENLLQEKHPQERLNTSLPDIGIASSCIHLRTPPCTPAACIESPLSRPETPGPTMVQASLKSPLSQHKSTPQGACLNASGRPHTPFPASTVPLPKKADYHAMGMHAQTHPTTTPPNIFFSKIRHSLAPQHKLPQQALTVNNIMNDSTESGGETGYFSLFSPTETPANNPFSNVFSTSPPDHSLNPFSSPITPHVAYPTDSSAYMFIPQQGGPDVPYYVRSASPYQPPVPGFIPYETPALLPLSQLQPVEQVFQQYFPGTPAVPAATLLTPPTVVPSPKVPTSPIPQSRNPTSNESADDEAESPVIKLKAQPSPKLTRKSTKKLQHQISTRTSSGDEGTGSSSNVIQRKPRKVSSSSHDEPNATSSPSSKHRNTIRKISSNEGGGPGSVLTEPTVASSDLSHSSTSGQESPNKQRRRVSIYFNNNNNNNNKAPSKRRDTVSISSIPGRGILTRSNSPELSRHERERSHSVSSSVRTNGSATSGRLRRHSGGGSTTDVGKVPWCACWGNGCI